MFCKHFHFVVDFKVYAHGFFTGTIVGIVAGACVIVILMLFALWKMGFLCQKDQTDQGKIEVQIKQAVTTLMIWFLILQSSDWFAVKHDAYTSIRILEYTNRHEYFYKY